MTRRDEGPEPRELAQSETDELFRSSRGPVEDFNFGRETAVVFDDMLDRSVPFYGEIQRQVAELAGDFAVEGSAIYDLGCSTCTSLVAIDRLLPPDLAVRYVGIDSSPEMLDVARRKITAAGIARPIELRLGDLDQGVAIADASVVLLVLTLQFVRPLHRERLIHAVAEGLRPGGCLLLVEKVLGESSRFNRLFIEHYYGFKRLHGYTELEIARKREALENVLVPYRIEENWELLRQQGFAHVDVFFKWYNFCGMVATR